MKAFVVTMALMQAACVAAEEKDFQVGRFNGIDASGAATIQYSVGDNCGVRAEGRAKDIERYEVKTSGNRLVIRIKPTIGRTASVEKTVFYVTGPANVREVELSGASSFVTESTLDGDGVTFDVSGASQVRCRKITSKNVKIDCSGASQVTFGRIEAANEVEFDISGASRCNAGVKGRTVEVDCSGTSHATLDVRCDDVDAEASGMSRITLTGRANMVRTDASGASSIDSQTLADTSREQSNSRRNKR